MIIVEWKWCLLERMLASVTTHTHSPPVVARGA